MKCLWLLGGLVLAGLGAALEVEAAVIFERDAEWRWRKGTSEASTPDRAAWRRADYDDRGWSAGRAPFFYGEAVTGTELADMRGGYTCLYLRRTFVVSDPAALGAVRLRALSDDGFAAWINGRPVARFNMPEGELSFNATALGTFNEPLPTEAYDIADFTEVLVPGINLIAVQACNASISGSSDFLFEASLEVEVDDVAPRVIRTLPAAGSRVRALSQVTVIFSEMVEGVDASDLRINGVPAVSLTAFGGDQYVFQFPAPAAGTVRMAWAADAGIRDRSALGNAFGGGAWEYTVDPNLPQPGVTISEFMADNDRTLNDEDGDASDWIEIENAAEQVVDLGGWAMTDDPAEPAKWRFPAVSVPSRGRLVVFASGKDRAPLAGELHTNFRLARDGGYLALMRADGSVASAFSPTYPPQRRDVSYGRLPTDPLKTGYFPVPTPGAPNSEGGPGFAPEVSFSRIGGTFTEPFSLVLGTGGAGGVVRYTLDGSIPTEASPEAGAPIRIASSTRVRARAFAPGLLPGRLAGEYYVQLNPTAAAVTSSLPLVLIHSFGGGAVPANGDYAGFVSFYEPRGGVASMNQAPDLRTRARINIRGSSTLFQPKRNYSVEFRDEQDEDRDLSPLGLPAESDWILYAPNNFEPVLIHNPFIYRISNEIGRYAPRTRFVEVYVQTGSGAVTSSQYVGIYVLMEKIKRGAERVDIHTLEPEHTQVPEITGGYLLKIDRLDPGDSGISAAGQRMGFVEPKEEEMRLPQRAPQFAYLQDYLNRFGQALNSASWTDPVIGWRAYVDEDSWIDHHILNVTAFNVDALRLSTYFYKPREGKLSFGPIWDFDRALNSTDGRDANPRVWRAAGGDQGTDFFNYPWWGRLFRDPDFWQKWIDRYQELRRGRFDTNYLFRVIDEMAAQVSPVQPREAARWPGFTTPRVSYANEVAILKTWLGRRIQFMDTNFLAAPTYRVVAEGPQGSRRAEFAGPDGATVYYTTDGSDPRARGGSLAASARAYAGSLALDAGTILRARSFKSTHRNLTGPNNPPISSPWSGVIELRASALPDAPLRRLLVSEIHARPAPPTTQELALNPGWSAGAFEFLEIWNAGSAAAVLGDLRFTAGIQFSFATSSVPVLDPGSRVVLVRDRAAFTARYGAGPVIAGVFEGNLDGGGETLRLADGLGRTVTEARYRTEGMPAADGLGFSLTLGDGAGPDPILGEDAWRVSGQLGGSPGEPDAGGASVPAVVVHEVLTHTDPPLLDGIELHNPGRESAAIGGWYLTDDREMPFKYRIPDGTVIPPGGYLWFDEGHFGPTQASPSGFRLDSTGDQVWLFAADGVGRLSGYAHGLEFGALPNGVSLGRELDCRGWESWVAQSAVTPGGANAGPGPVSMRISEIHYRPPDIRVGVEAWNDTALEFIELANLSDLPVELFDPVRPTNTWRLKGAVGFRFPGQVVVPARGTVLVVNFDPETNPAALMRFRQVYGVPAGTPVLGPYSSSLPNDEGKVELARPDMPQAAPAPDAGQVPDVVVDQVRYRDEAPWSPLADGTGRSLSRVAWDRPDVGPRAWVAWTPSPGRIAEEGIDSDADGMPDTWEARGCLDPNDGTDGEGDWDGDGARNRDEWVARTDPSDATDVLGWTAAGVDDTGRARLEFHAKAGVGYGVEASDLLAPGGWQRVQEVAPSGTSRTVVVEDLVGGGFRFYRLVVLTPP